jgi:SNF2 family DNA or RNA helicase
LNTCTLVEQHGTKKFWEIACEPHVTTRLKRVFSRLSSASQGVHHLSDTTEVARDLLWFFERYPFEVKPLAYLKRRAKEHRDREAFIAELLSSRAPTKPFDLAIPPREYQQQAAHLALTSGGLLLADDVGLGKTASAICTFTDPRVLPVCVVTLTHLGGQWEREIKRFAPQLKAHVLRTTSPYDLRFGIGGPSGPCAKGKHRMRADSLAAGGESCARCAMTRDDIYHRRSPRMPDVIICTYSKLAGWAETLRELVKGVVFDECQELRTGARNGAGESIAKYAGALEVTRDAVMRLGLSATPIYNYGIELWNVMNVLAPDALGTKGEFTREWCENEGRIGDPRAFGLHVRKSGLMLRRTRHDVARELPPVSTISHHVDADADALDKVSTECAELARLILRDGPADKGLKFRASEELSNKLRQATGIAKAPYVAAFVRLLVENGERVVLFGWHRMVYDIWLDRLKGLEPRLYTGSESVTEKERAVKSFTSGESKVLIVSLRSGAGLDGLQHVSRTCVFGELDWSPGVHEQCVGRVARDGQQDPVAAYYLIAEAGADPIIADVLGVKSEQIDGVRDPDADVVQRLEVDPNHVKRLAESYLVQRNIQVPKSEAPEVPALEVAFA